MLFSCKTNEGHIVKILAELLQNNIKNGCFNIDENGIKFRMFDSNKRILIDICLKANCFSPYKYEHDEEMITIFLNQSHFHKMLKSIKKKDSIALFIEKDRPKDLGITIIPKEKNRVTTSYITIQNIQQIGISLPKDYQKPIVVPSNEYQKMCKDMANIGNSIVVSSKKYSIKFACNGGKVYSREVTFGDVDEEDADTEEVSQEFDTEQLTRIAKIAGLSNNMQIYQENNKALLFKSQIGNLGEIAIYVKSKKEIEDDEKGSVSDDEDE